jgi:hypothetical protein
MQVTPMPPTSNKKTGVLRRGVFAKSRVLYVSLCGIPRTARLLNLMQAL